MVDGFQGDAPRYTAAVCNQHVAWLRPENRRRIRRWVFSRAILIRHFLVAALLLTVIAAAISGLDLKALLHDALDLLRQAGPTWFFLAMALLPSVGAPLSFFCLTAGSVFAPQLGMPSVMLLCLAAIATNIALSYILARRALRPALVHLLMRLGYQLPKVQSGDTTDLIVLLRVTPGLPFPVQNYLLGLAAVPFARYFTISCLIALPLNAAIIFFGEALLQGRGRMALIGLLLLLVVVTAIHGLRRRFREIKKPAT